MQQAKTIHFCGLCCSQCVGGSLCTAFIFAGLRCSHFAGYVARSTPALCVQKCRTIHGLGCVNHRAWVTQPILWHICIMLFSEWNKRTRAPAFRHSVPSKGRAEWTSMVWQYCSQEHSVTLAILHNLSSLVGAIIYMVQTNSEWPVTYGQIVWGRFSCSSFLSLHTPR